MLSPEGLRYFARGHMVMQPMFLDKLQSFRNMVAAPFYVNFGEHKLRGWRSWKENMMIDGKLYHPQGLAADVTVAGMDILEIGRAAKHFGFHGVGLYDTWVHMDMRPIIRESDFFSWDYRTDKSKGTL